MVLNPGVLAHRRDDDSVKLSKPFVSVNCHSAMTSMVEACVILVIQLDLVLGII